MSVKEIRKQEPNPNLIKHLKGLTKDAESGDLQGIIGVVIYEDGTTSDHWTAPPKSYQISIISDRVIGCLEGIKYQLFSGRFGINADNVWY